MSDARDDVPRFDALSDPVVRAVQADLAARSEIGMAKYGCTLERLTRRDALEHAYQEALDLANYLKRALMALDGEG